MDVGRPLGQRHDLLDTLRKQLASPEHAAVRLHRLADAVRDFLRVFTRARAFKTGEPGEGCVTRLRRKTAMPLILELGIDNMIACSTTEDQQIEQRIRAQSIGAVHRHAGAFADRVQPFDHGIVVTVMRRNHLTVNIGGDATHLVVNRRHDRNRVANRIDIGELDRDLADRGQFLDDLVCAEVIELEQNVIAVRATAAAFLDFLIHRARDEVARSEILERGRIALHEALAVLVEQNAAFAANTFCNQHAGAGHAGGMKLPELHVFEGQPSAGSHAHTITRVDEGIG